MFAKGKEKKPQETVQNIKEILEKLDIELNEIGYECMNGLSSVQLYDPMCNWRVWGKGTDPEWALASAYGEAVERLSNFVIYKSQWDYSDGPKWPFEKRLPINALWDSRDAADDFSRLCIHENDTDKEAFLEEYLGTKELSFIPYTSLKTGKEVYLPEDVINCMSGSNAMAAGNTQEEALCQALCETAERYSKFQIILNGYTPPEIDRKILEELAPEALDIINEAEKKFDLKIVVRDASLLKDLPVLNVVFFDKSKELYASRFGAHPLFNVALERCLTEMAQGRSDLKTKDYMLPVHSDDANVLSFRNLADSFRNDFADMPKTFFEGGTTWEFSRWKNFGDSNSEWNKSLINSLLKLSGDVYYRKTSFLGLFAVRLYVPKVSVLPFKIGKNNLQNAYLREIIHSPERLSQIKTAAEAKRLLNVLTDLNSSVGNKSDNLLLESDIGISADNLKKLLLKIVDGSDKDALENHFGISPFMREIRLLRKQENEEKILLSRKEQEKKLRKRLLETEGK